MVYYPPKGTMKKTGNTALCESVPAMSEGDRGFLSALAAANVRDAA